MLPRTPIPRHIGFIDFSRAKPGEGHWALYGLSAAGSVRLDNEEELARALGTRPTSAAGERGLDLVVRAYERWGKDFAAHLVGDFAVVVFDRALGVACAARDPFGVRPLAYRRTKHGMAFASDAGALNHFEGELGEIDERSVRDFLTGDERSSTRTFFREVHRLAPGHVLRADRTSTAVVRYWFPPDHVRTETREACLEEFSTRFKRAVSDRLRSESPILVQVSGGLDSSSIACVAAALAIDRKPPLHFMSAHFSEADERPFLASLEGHLRSPIAVFDADPGDDDEPLDRSHPSRYPLAAMTAGITSLAARTGARVVLSGMGGDELLFERGVYRDLAADARWLTLWREAGLANRYSTRSRSFYLLDALRPRTLPKALTRAVRFVRSLRGQRRLPWLRLPPTEADDSPSVGDLPNHAWLSQTQQFTWQWLTGARLVGSLEAEDRAASRDGLEMRYPFLDRRVAELVLGTAYEHRIPSGRLKVLLRDALVGVLPHRVRERTQVTTFDAVIAAAVVRKSRFVTDAIERGPWRSERYVDRGGARAALRDFLADPADCAAAITVWDIASLEHWLRAVT
ncbi:MAG: asparagine synthase-related protein [Polyangiaceae bacterium]